MKLTTSAVQSKLNKIEEELERLNKERESILAEENQRKEKEQDARKQEVTVAYNKFADLLEKYLNDYDDSYSVKTTCSFNWE